MQRFAFYGRVGSARLQDVVASYDWQVSRARQLIEPRGGVVVAEFFDIGHTRALPWQRRPKASELLAVLRDPTRGFGAVVIGEPQRAFYGNQFSLTYPIFEHFGVGLWVPEVGGPIDPGSEAHDLAMTLFGSQSKSERMRVKTRVRAAMAAQTAIQGRYLGGRPPYGYRLADAGPHPNPAKARFGVRLHVLEPDPVTAPMVARIYRMFLQGLGYLAIAEQLNAEQVPSPSGHDPDRNPHRHGIGWTKHTIRAILVNPRYTGHQVWNKQRRDEVLLDIDDVAAGYVGRVRWNPTNAWIYSEQPAHQPLVPKDDFDRVQAVIGARAWRHKPHKPTPPRGSTYSASGYGAACASAACKATGSTPSPTTAAPTHPPTRPPPAWRTRARSTYAKPTCSPTSTAGSPACSTPTSSTTPSTRWSRPATTRPPSPSSFTRPSRPSPRPSGSSPSTAPPSAPAPTPPR